MELFHAERYNNNLSSAHDISFMLELCFELDLWPFLLSLQLPNSQRICIRLCWVRDRVKQGWKQTAEPIEEEYKIQTLNILGPLLTCLLNIMANVLIFSVMGDSRRGLNIFFFYYLGIAFCNYDFSQPNLWLLWCCLILILEYFVYTCLSSEVWNYF